MTELAVREKQELVRLDTEQIKFLAHTEFVPERIRGNLPAIFATIATGREIGIGDMAALRHVHMIEGKPGTSAEIMVARVHSEGHTLDGEVGPDQATARGKRKDTGAAMTFTYTMAMAEQAGLLGKQNWKKHPQSMLWARAASQLCRMLFPDCMSGATYTKEELEDSVGGPEPVGAAHADGMAGAADDPSAPVSQPALGGGEAASPTDTDAASSGGSNLDEPSEVSAEGNDADLGAAPPVDLSDPDIPFGDAPYPPLPSGWKDEKEQKKWLKKADLLVKADMPRGRANHPDFTLERVYLTVAVLRGWTRQELENTLKARDDEGVLHWAPLRVDLSKHEAGALIDKLEALEATV